MSYYTKNNKIHFNDNLVIDNDNHTDIIKVSLKRHKEVDHEQERA